MIVKLKGGIGNQMFQYAFGRAQSIRLGSPLFLDIEGYKHQAKTDTLRLYELDNFNIEAKTIEYHINTSKNLFKKIIKRLYPEKIYSFDQNAIKNIKADSYLEGWWQTEKYFSDIGDTIRKELSLKKPFSIGADTIASEIRLSKKSVSLHIRRGDYVSNAYASAYHGTTGLEYYKNALHSVISKIGSDSMKLFIFSDDTGWAKEHMPSIVAPNIQVTYVSDKAIPDFEEVILMSMCRHNIIANSSFSWFGAWLNENPDKIVIAPKQWLLGKKIDTRDAVPEKWIRL